MTTETRHYRLTGLTSILGSQPSSETIRTNFLLAKHPEVDASGEIVPAETEENGQTVFYRDENDNLVLLDYQVKGYFKAAMTALKADLGIGMPAKKNDQFLFVEPRCIPLMRNGKTIQDEDEILERPLRGQTMQGERISLASSEMVSTPWQIDVAITVLKNIATAKSAALTFDAVEKALDYGRFSGIGQWRNGGYGRFTWERMDK